MGSRSRTARRRKEKGQESPDREFFGFRWRDSWGRPPVLVYRGMWVVGGPCALIGFGVAAGLLVMAVNSAAREPAFLLIGIPASFVTLLVTYWFVWRPMWRFHCYYNRFTSEGRFIPDAANSSDALEESSTSEPLAEPMYPGSRQYDKAIEACTSAIGSQFAIRQARQQDFRQAARQLHFAVDPKEEGQVDLERAYEVRSDELVLHYGIVKYNTKVRDGRRVSHSVSVGHVIILSLGCDLGRVWIRSEGLVDKLGEFVFSRDIDFSEHPRFSSRYLLHADDAEQLERSVPSDFWQALGEHRRLVCVGRESTLVIGKDGRIGRDDALDIVTLGFRLMRSFGLPARGRGTPDSRRS
jgi:hypothetical protein